MEQSGFRSQIEAKKVVDYYLTASSGGNMYSSPPLMTVMNKVKNGKFIVKGMRNQQLANFFSLPSPKDQVSL